MGLSGKGWENYLAEETDLDRVQRALVRERVIRDLMAKSGEGREPVAEMVDAMDSMGQESVLELTDGEPTTLRDALDQYTQSLSEDDVYEGVRGELEILLAYPWSGEEALIQLHDPHHGLRLYVENPDDEHVEIRIGSNRWLIASGNYDELGGSGMGKMIEVAEAVYRATLARVIPDREHIVQLSGAELADLRAWLERPNGAIRVAHRLTLDAAGGGALVRTRPYHFQLDSDLSRRT